MGDCARFFALKTDIFEEQFFFFPTIPSGKKLGEDYEITSSGQDCNELTSLNLPAPVVEEPKKLYYLEEDDLSYIEDYCIQQCSLLK